MILAVCAVAFADPPAPQPPATVVQPQLGHTFPVTSVAWSPDGRLVASGGGDQTVRLWDVGTGRLLRIFRTGGEPTVAFRADGSLVVADQAMVHAYDVVTGEETWSADTGADRAVVSSDGTYVAMTKWSPDHLDEIGNWTCQYVAVQDVGGDAPDGGYVEMFGAEEALCPEAPWMAAGGGWVAASEGAITRVARKDGTGDLRIPGAAALAFSADGTRLYAATGGEGGFQPDLTVWDPATGKRLARVKKAFPSSVSYLAVSPDGTRLAASDDDDDHLWVLDVAANTRTPPAAYPTSSVGWSPDGRSLVLGHRRNGDLDVQIVDLGAASETLAATKGAPAATGSGGKAATKGAPAATVTVTETFAGKLPPATSVAFAKDRLLVGTDDGQLAVWSTATLGLERTLPVASQSVLSIAVSPDGKRAIPVALDVHFRYVSSAPRVVDVVTGQPGAEMPVAATSAAFVDDRTVALGTDDGHVTIASADGAVLRTIETPQSIVALAAAGPRLVACGSSVTAWDAGAWDAPAWSVSEDMEPCVAAAVAPDGRVAVVRATSDAMYGDSSGLDILSDDDGSVLVHVEYGEDLSARPLTVAWTDDGRVAVGDDQGVVRVWEIEYGSEEARQEHLGPVTSVASRGGLVLDDGLSDPARLWRVDTGDAVQLASNEASDWVMFASDGLFDASRNGGDLVGVVRGLDAWGIDQFAVQTNRPDLVLARMGLGTPEIVAHYRARYERRVAKLGLTARSVDDSSAVPTVTVSSSSQEGRRLTVSYAAHAEAGLARADLYVNDVPVASRKLDGGDATGTETVDLLGGEDVVEVAVVDAQGVESRRALVRAHVDQDTPGDLWFVGFGVSDYTDPRLPDLGYADDDARALGETFAKVHGFGATHVRVLTDAEVTPRAVDDARAFVAQAGVDDTVVVFVAGHGLHDRDANATYYFLTHDADLDRLATTAASFERVEALLQGIPARRKLMLLDTCESGEKDDDAPAATSLEGSRGVARGVRIATAAASTAAPRPWLYDRDRYVYNDLSRRTGAIVLSSSRGGEYSYESAALGHGFFTTELIAALTTNVADTDGDGVVSVDELRTYTARAVAERSADQQHPVVDRDNLRMKFGFGLR